MAAPIDTPERAIRLARTIASDISLYNEEKIIRGLSEDKLFTELSDEIEEGRELYRARVSPELYERTNFFDRAVVDIILKSKGHVRSKILVAAHLDNDLDDDDRATTTTVDVPLEAAGARLDAFLAARMPLSRSRLDALIGDARVTVDGRAAKKSDKLRGGEVVCVVEPAPAPAELVPQDLPLAVLYEDDDLLVVDKAAGMPVHPGAGNPDGTVANAVLFRCPGVAVGGERRPGIVHRLDKDTSGVLVVCKNDASLAATARAFAERRVDKRYRAYCLGRPREDAFELVTGHRRATGDRRRFTTKVPPPTEASGGRLARSRFVVTASIDGVSALDVELLTGRTHQIRAHLADIGHPLAQDALYGGGHAEKRLRPGAVHDAVAALKRQALHAATLALAHPRTGTQLRFEAPLPADLLRLDEALR